MKTWERTPAPLEPEEDDLLPWAPGDGFPDGNDSLRHGLEPDDARATGDGDDAEVSPSWKEHLALPDGPPVG